MDEDLDERVDFRSLYTAVNRPADDVEETPSRSESRVSIIELAETTVFWIFLNMLPTVDPL